MSEIPPPSVPPSYPPPPGGGSYTPPPPPPPPGSGGAPSSDRTIMLVLSYLWILFLVPLLAKKDDPEVQWHAKNGFALFITEIVVWVACRIVIHFIPFAGCGLSLVSCVVWLGFLAIRVMAIVKATQGQRMRIPVISDFADKM